MDESTPLLEKANTSKAINYRLAGSLIEKISREDQFAMPSEIREKGLNAPLT